VKKKHDFEHEFTNEGVVCQCSVRVYKEDIERPVVIATQPQKPQGEYPNSVFHAANVIAAYLIKNGTLREFHVNYEPLTEPVQKQSTEPVAPFVFVEEYLEPEHFLAFIRFASYEIEGRILARGTEEHIGNPSREETSRAEVEKLIGACLDD
jgi:hypothetical protein